MTRPEEMTLSELVESHPDPIIRATAKALLDILKDNTPLRTDSLRVRDLMAPH